MPAPKQVFLGGTCGRSTWRRAIAIPALEAAGVSYFDPQLAPGAWTPEREAEEMRAKDAADALLFVVSGETRGVASLAEVAYLLAARRPLALAVSDVLEENRFEGCPPGPGERDDLNRGRIFVRTMAAVHGVPVFAEVGAAVQYAIALVRAAAGTLDLAGVQAILEQVRFDGLRFVASAGRAGFELRIEATVADVVSAVPAVFSGRRWHIEPNASAGEIVQTAFKAVLTWQEHEVRERFRFRGAPVYGPHQDVERLAELWRTTRTGAAD